MPRISASSRFQAALCPHCLRLQVLRLATKLVELPVALLVSKAMA